MSNLFVPVVNSVLNPSNMYIMKSLISSIVNSHSENVQGGHAKLYASK